MRASSRRAASAVIVLGTLAPQARAAPAPRHHIPRCSRAPAGSLRRNERRAIGLRERRQHRELNAARFDGQRDGPPFDDVVHGRARTSPRDLPIELRARRARPPIGNLECLIVVKRLCLVPRAPALSCKSELRQFYPSNAIPIMQRNPPKYRRRNGSALAQRKGRLYFVKNSLS